MISRETIYAALFAKLSAISGLNRSSRVIPNFNDIPSGDCPALVMEQGVEVPSFVRGVPSKWTLRVNVYIFAHSNDILVAPQTILNALKDKVEAALSSDVLSNTECTLGGLVSHCRISGNVEHYEGSTDRFLCACIIPIEIVAA
jgi:hypothetical protein